MTRHPHQIRIEDYDYPLEETLIAKYPLEQRDQSRLLFYRKGTITEHKFYEAPELLPSNSMLVFNETKVVQARLLFKKPTGARIEIFVLEPNNKDIHEAFQSYGEGEWRCFVGNAKKWKEGTLTLQGEDFELQATQKEQSGNSFLIRFKWDRDKPFSQILEKAGEIPLPPYLKREAQPSDRSRYQTVYARQNGSVAAPTAGLHFTEKTLNRLNEKNIQSTKVTLHVGAGTFKPVSEKTIGEHEMHTEQIVVGRKTIEQLLLDERMIVAVGTTSVRTLESLYWYGVKLSEDSSAAFSINQWFPYESITKTLPSKKAALLNILDKLDREQKEYIRGETQVIIAPGYNYKLVDAMFTNFHMPKSTLLLLVAAYLGEDWRKVYHYALENNFRFLSYGDSCLFIK